MHNLKSLLIPSILFSPLASFLIKSEVKPAVKDSQITSGVYGPFNGGSNSSYVDITYKHSGSITTAIAKLEIYSIPTKLEAVYSNVYREYVPGTKYYFTFNVDIDKYILPNGVNVWFLIYEKDTNNILFYDSETVYPAIKENIRLNNLNNYIYTSIDYLFTFNTSLLVTQKNHEVINFSPFINNIFYQEEYGRVSFNNYIIYKFGKDLSDEGEIYLSFDDKYELFPYLKNVDGKKVIEFTFKKRSSLSTYYDISLSPLYVNLQTYEVSYLPRSGFVSTDTFYFPKNKKEEIENMFFQLSFKNFGASKSDYVYDGTFAFNKNHIGNCSNSSYCVNGEIK